MHPAVSEWVGSVLERRQKSSINKQTGNNVLEIGSFDINGTIRHLFDDLITEGGSYIGIDLQEGPGVDIVVDAVAIKTKTPMDIIVCAEVFEHTPVWPAIIKNAHSNLRPGGLFIATMAGIGRPPHSAIDAEPIRSWEYYKNVGKDELAHCLGIFTKAEVNVHDTDLRCWAIK
jgi:hypothetical protein